MTPGVSNLGRLQQRLLAAHELAASRGSSRTSKDNEARERVYPWGAIILLVDVEKTVHFILDQQAQFAVGMQQLREAHEALTGEVRRVAQNQLALAESQGRQQEMIGQSVTIVRQLAENQQRTDQRVKELAESQHHTDQNLNALIKTVDELIRRDGRNR